MENRIAEFRKQAKLSQEKLASAVGITRPFLSDVERGIKNPNAKVAKVICEALGVSFEALFCAQTVNGGGHSKIID